MHAFLSIYAPKLSSQMPPRSLAVGSLIKGRKANSVQSKTKGEMIAALIVFERFSSHDQLARVALEEECILTKPCCVSAPVGKHLFPSLCKHVCIPSVFPLLSSLWRPADLLISCIYPIITCCSCDAQNRRDAQTGALAVDVDSLLSSFLFC